MNGETLLGQEYVDGLKDWTPFTVSNETLDAMRVNLAAAPAPPESDVVFTDYELQGGDVVVRVHRSPSNAVTDTLPCVYSIHGGGYVLGDYTMDDARFARWCPVLHCVG